MSATRNGQGIPPRMNPQTGKVLCSRCLRDATRFITGGVKRTFYCNTHVPTSIRDHDRLQPLPHGELHVNHDSPGARQRAAVKYFGQRPGPVVEQPMTPPAPLQPGSSNGTAPSSLEAAKTAIDAVIEENLDLRRRLAKSEERAAGAQAALEKAMAELRKWEELADQLTRPTTK